MKLLILAQTPPPLHGQSLMVRTAVEGLPAHGVAVHHVNLRLSRSHADIGRWRLGKVLAILDACFHAIIARFAAGCDTLYYVPAPGKRGALYRDWLVMLLVRPFYRRLVLHFHNGGLGDWLAHHASVAERALTRLFLGRADLAIVLTPTLRDDAVALDARKIAVVPNGIADPGQPPTTPPKQTPAQLLFLGQCSAAKGLDVLLDAFALLSDSTSPAIRLVVAGGFASATECEHFTARFARFGGGVVYAGFVRGMEKRRLLDESACLVLPTCYAHEAQPLVLLEALAHDLSVVATNWRGIRDTIDGPHVRLVRPGDAPALVRALREILAALPPAGALRREFLTRHTAERHLASLAGALHSL